MEMASRIRSILFFLSYIAVAKAFCPVAKSRHVSVHQSSLRSMQSSANTGDQGSARMQQRKDFLASMGVILAGTFVSSAAPAQASVPASPSSSIYLSDDIKTIDMALPSYDKVNTLKADEKALGVEDIPEPKAKGKSQPKKKAAAGSGGGNPMGKVLPSMNKSGPSKKEKQPKEKPKKKEKEAPAPKVEYETMDFALPSSSDFKTKEKSVFAL